MSELNQLAGKVAVITGTSKGIGAALAVRLAKAGVHLGLGSRSGGGPEIDGAVSLKCDVRDPEQVEKLVQATVERFGKLDIAVANAGVGSYSSIVDTPAEQVEEIIDTNIKGTIYLLRSALPHILNQGGGDIVVVSSEAGRRGLPGEPIYVSSKFAQVGLVRSLDHELREKNVRCFLACPGAVATNFALDDGRGRTPEMVAAAHMLEADDVVDVIEFTLQRPRRLRLEVTAMRSMTEASWG
ncbi:MAG: SDR family oxidoreductase [Propionibacteriaceae bacterium]|nr:SDR family oxidoreductase [Propionibacteriaceae bacterium]